ncbi:MAG: toprim domain-containing protein [Alphaproteobacteria bacterium]|nr:toprim domain-containing protein [Alphaproteobacteria bacterium]
MTDGTQRIAPAEIERVKTGVDLAAIVGAKIKLQRRGSEWVGLCPFHSEGTPSFYVLPKKHICHCFGCSTTVDVFEFLKRTEGLSFVEAYAKLNGSVVETKKRFVSASAADNQVKDDAADQRRRIDKARAIWDESGPALRTPVETYLKSRGIHGVALPPTIRFHPSLYHKDTRRNYPAMVAAVWDNQRRLVGVHRTYLSPDGRSKAGTGDDKLALGLCKGAHIWLGMPTNGRLAIAEGIETALSVKMARPDLCLWTSLWLGNLGAPVPASITEIIICADNDSKDPAKAAADINMAVAQLSRPGRTVRVAWPDKGKDFNDMVKRNG